MRVFISYAWENDDYWAFVKRPAKRLGDDGIDLSQRRNHMSL